MAEPRLTNRPTFIADAPADSRVAATLARLEATIGDSWTVAELADNARVSVSHFVRIFRRQTGQAPLSYMRQRRLQLASEQLTITDKQVKLIRADVGILDASHFARDFRRRFGSSPSAYRKTQWKREIANE